MIRNTWRRLINYLAVGPSPRPILVKRETDHVPLPNPTSVRVVEEKTYGTLAQPAPKLMACHRCHDALIPVGRYYCGPCNAIVEHDAWLRLPEAEWNGTDLLVLHGTDRYFSDWSEVCEYAYDVLHEQRNLHPVHDTVPEGDCEAYADALDLVICVPNYGDEISEDHFVDDLPEDGELYIVAPTLNDLVEAVNRHIRAKQEILSWREGPTRMKKMETHHGEG